MLINIASRQLVVLHRYRYLYTTNTNYIYLETMWETDTTVVIYSWKYRAMMSCASHLISHFTYWGSIANKEFTLCCCILWYPQVTNVSKLDLMPNISMIEKVVQQVYAIDYLVSKYTFLLINQFIQWQNFLFDEDISRMGLLSSSKECTHWPLSGCA